MNGASVRAVEAELVPHFDVIEHNPQLIEVVPKGYTKATGIAQVCDMLGIARENTYAFGEMCIRDRFYGRKGAVSGKAPGLPDCVSVSGGL